MGSVGYQVLVKSEKLGIIFHISKVYPTYRGALRRLTYLIRFYSNSDFYYTIKLAEIQSNFK